MRKPAFCICENKAADQLRSNCAADQRLCIAKWRNQLAMQNFTKKYILISGVDFDQYFQSGCSILT